MRVLAPLLCSFLLLWSHATAAAADRPSLADTVQHRRFITYTPRSFAVVHGKPVAATESGIRADLTLLRPYFDSLITYAADNGQENIPQIAADLGYRSLIMGIWNPASEVEIANAITVAKKHPGLVAAIIIGNEGIFTKRYRTEDIIRTSLRLKAECPTLPTTTSEPFFLYFKKEFVEFFKGQDLLMPNVHPVFEKWFDPKNPLQGVALVANVTEQFKRNYQQPLLIKETGLPSGQDSQGFSSERQSLFWAGLFSKFPFSPRHAFACFEAFDAPWKPTEMAATFPGEHGNEAFWGFFTADGKAKAVVKSLPALPPE